MLIIQAPEQRRVFPRHHSIDILSLLQVLSIFGHLTSMAPGSTQPREYRYQKGKLETKLAKVNYISLETKPHYQEQLPA